LLTIILWALRLAGKQLALQVRITTMMSECGGICVQGRAMVFHHPTADNKPLDRIWWENAPRWADFAGDLRARCEKLGV
jgi:hypothetical protein